MYKSILISILMLISASSFAAPLTVNGISCGSWTRLEMGADNSLSLATDGACGTVAPPVEPPSSACPAGVRCIDRPWPINPQETVTLDGNSVLAIKVRAGESGAGKLATAYTSGQSGNRQVVISSKPGDFAPVAPCASTGTQTTMTYWAIGAGKSYQCAMTAGQTYWINIKHTNCAGRCEFILKGY